MTARGKEGKEETPWHLLSLPSNLQHSQQNWKRNLQEEGSQWGGAEQQEGEKCLSQQTGPGTPRW